jgi:hypothetical protein
MDEFCTRRVRAPAVGVPTEPPLNVDEFRAHAEQVIGAQYSRRDPRRDDERLDIITRTPHGHESSVAAAIELHALLRTEGLVGITLPEIYGGQGLGEEYEEALEQVLAAYDTLPQDRSAMGLTWLRQRCYASEPRSNAGAFSPRSPAEKSDGVNSSASQMRVLISSPSGPRRPVLAISG